MIHVTERALILVLALAAAAFASCSDTPTAPTRPVATYSQTDLRVGAGVEAVSGRTMLVHYTGWHYDPNQPEQKGARFDTSIGGNAFPFVLGAGRVIRGWDQGLVGMRAGGLRRLVLPPELAYGAAGNPPAIPPNASLVFDVELLSVQ